MSEYPINLSFLGLRYFSRYGGALMAERLALGYERFYTTGQFLAYSSLAVFLEESSSGKVVMKLCIVVHVVSRVWV